MKSEFIHFDNFEGDMQNSFKILAGFKHILIPILTIPPDKNILIVHIGLFKFLEHDMNPVEELVLKNSNFTFNTVLGAGDSA